MTQTTIPQAQLITSKGIERAKRGAARLAEMVEKKDAALQKARLALDVAKAKHDAQLTKIADLMVKEEAKQAKAREKAEQKALKDAEKARKAEEKARIAAEKQKAKDEKAAALAARKELEAKKRADAKAIPMPSAARTTVAQPIATVLHAGKEYGIDRKGWKILDSWLPTVRPASWGLDSEAANEIVDVLESVGMDLKNGDKFSLIKGNKAYRFEITKDGKSLACKIS